MKPINTSYYDFTTLITGGYVYVDKTAQLYELAITEKDGKVWGAELELTEDWREIRLPFSKLRYFGHWGNVPAFKPGWTPDCRQFTRLRFCFGTWLCPKTTDKAHGLEVSSVKVVQ